MNPAKSSSSPPETHRSLRAADGVTNGPPNRPLHGPEEAGMGVGAAAVWLGLSSVLVAAACAYGLSLWLGPSSPWAAALGAALGLAAAALPLTMLLRRVSGHTPPPHGADGLGDSLAPVGVERELFMNLAEREWARARRYGSGAALLWVDVDRYARLCESRGTPAGEAVLMQLLLKTAPTLRPADLITRLRNGRMAVFLAHADATGALDVAERIRERAEQQQVQMHAPVQTLPASSPASSPINHGDASAPGGPALRVTVSVGVATLRPAHLNLQALMDDADEAVAAARQAGGNCVRAAPVDAARLRDPSKWGGEDRRTRPTKPKQGGSSK
jgi:diguanylate cyclase